MHTAELPHTAALLDSHTLPCVLLQTAAHTAAHCRKLLHTAAHYTNVNAAYRMLHTTHSGVPQLTRIKNNFVRMYMHLHEFT
jgi:hypothetical protein